MNEINMEPERAIEAGRRLGDTGQRIVQAGHEAGDRIEQAHQPKPWGDDRLGNSFAQAYSPVAAKILEAWQRDARRVAELGNDIVAAADAMIATDGVASDRLTSAPTPPTGPAPRHG